MNFKSIELPDGTPDTTRAMASGDGIEWATPCEARIKIIPGSNTARIVLMAWNDGAPTAKPVMVAAQSDRTVQGIVHSLRAIADGLCTVSKRKRLQ